MHGYGTNLCLGGNNLALTNTLCGSGHGERLLQILTENDIFDEHALHLNSPASGNLLNNLPNGLSNLFAALDNILQNTGTDDVSQSGLSALDEGLTHVSDAEGCLVRADDMVVNDGGQMQGNVVLGHADLLGDFNDLNLDVDLDNTLRQGVDLDQAGIDSLVETAEFGDEANVALIDILVRIGAANAARDGAKGTDNGTQAVDCDEVSLADDMMLWGACLFNSLS